MTAATGEPHEASVPGFTCLACQARFGLPGQVSEMFPGWVPQLCLRCRAERARPKPGLDPADVLARYSAGPQTGVFVKGTCELNPGQGVWAAVMVANGDVITERSGQEPDATAPRMELRALIEGMGLLAPREQATIYSESEVCVRTLKEWAPAWQKNGWRRGSKRERVANLDLVQRAFDIYQARPNMSLEWIDKPGVRWSEYAAALSRSQFFGSADGHRLRQRG